MKILHVSPLESYLKHQKNFTGHALEVENGMVIMVSTMNQFAQEMFEKEAGVLPLPFILSSEPVGPEIAKHLVRDRRANRTSVGQAIIILDNYYQRVRQ
jgi:hypothetical protein